MDHPYDLHKTDAAAAWLACPGCGHVGTKTMHLLDAATPLECPRCGHRYAMPPKNRLDEQVASRRTTEAFDAMVRLLIEVEHRDTPRINGHHVRAAAERVCVLSAHFDAIDIDACVRRLEYGYAAQRAIHEARHG